MKLRDLVKDLQDDLATQVLDFIIYKEGRSWSYESYDQEDADDVKEYERIKSIDSKAIIVNGFDSFAAYDLKYLEFQVKRLYK